MKFNRARTKTRQIAYSVELSEYDANPPVPQLLLDDLPLKLNPELEAISLYLIFGPWCGGEFVTPAKMGPNTAATISSDAIPDFFCGPIEYYPKALPLGVTTVRVTDTLRRIDECNTISCLDSTQWNGSIRSLGSLAVASNYRSFMRYAGDPRPLIGVALLFAEEMNANTLVFPKGTFEASEFKRYLKLLQAVRMELVEGE